MSRNTNGSYALPTGNPVQYDTVIDPPWANGTLADIAAALTDSLSRSGKGGMQASLGMGGFRVTNAAGAQASTDLPNALQVRNGTFTWLFPVSSDASGNAYTATSPLPDAPVAGTAFSFVADKANTGAMTLSVNGGAALPILVNGAAATANAVLAGMAVQVVLFNNIYRMVGSPSANGVGTVSSTLPQVLTGSVAGGTLTLEPHVNIPYGALQLDGAGLVPPVFWPTTPQQFLGPWNLTPGVLPPNGTSKGQYYLITNAGTAFVYTVNAGTQTYAPHNVIVPVGGLIVWNDANTVDQPNGWYRVLTSVPTTAAQVTNVATSLFPAVVDVQAWLDAMDAYVQDLLPLTGGALTGDVTQAAPPAGVTSLVTMQYVLDQIAALNVGLTSFQGRATAAAVLLAADILSALGYTPANQAGDTFGGTIAAPAVAATYFYPVPRVANIAGVQNIDFLAGQSQILTLTATASIASIINMPQGTLLRLTLKATNLVLTSWPASVKWPGTGTPPDLTTGTLKKAVVVIENDGTDLLASASVY